MKLLLSLVFIATAACGSKTPAPEPGPGDGTGAGPATGAGTASPSSGCKRGGCSSQLCVEATDDAISTCEFRPEYACYASAECTRQPDGACGWTQTAALTACIASPPPAPSEPAPQ